MQYHKLTEHFDEKPFSCEKCGAKFAANSTLKNHLRLHTGDRPFVCKHCLMTFMQASALAYHTKKKHSEGESSPREPIPSWGVRLGLPHPLLPALLLHLPPCCWPLSWSVHVLGGRGLQAALRSASFLWFQLLTLLNPSTSSAPFYLLHVRSLPPVKGIFLFVCLVFLLGSSALSLHI